MLLGAGLPELGTGHGDGIAWSSAPGRPAAGKDDVRIGIIHSAVFDTVPRTVAVMREDHQGITVGVHEGWTATCSPACGPAANDLVLSRDALQYPDYKRETPRS